MITDYEPPENPELFTIALAGEKPVIDPSDPDVFLDWLDAADIARDIAWRTQTDCVVWQVEPVEKIVVIVKP